MTVTTDAVVWIEIGLAVKLSEDASVSPLMQWCGVKSEYNRLFHTCVEVTTDAVVWIEIGLNTFSNGRKSVTTDAVVWIEIVKVKTTDQMPRGHH